MTISKKPIQPGGTKVHNPTTPGRRDVVISHEGYKDSNKPTVRPTAPMGRDSRPPVKKK